MAKARKKNKKFLGTICIMAMSFVLALSLGIGATIAWFGGTSGTGTGTLNFGGAVSVGIGAADDTNGGDEAMTFELKTSDGGVVLPASTITILAVAHVYNPSTAVAAEGQQIAAADQVATKANLRAHLSIKCGGVSIDPSKFFAGAGTTVEDLLYSTGGKWVDSTTTDGDGAGLFYWCTEKNATLGDSQLVNIDATVEGNTVVLFGSSTSTGSDYTVNKVLDNSFAGKVVTISIRFDAVQAFNGTDTTNTITSITTAGAQWDPAGYTAIDSEGNDHEVNPTASTGE